MITKKGTIVIVAALMSFAFVTSTTIAVAASSSFCNSASCDNPPVSTVIEQGSDRPLTRPTPINICEYVNSWKVDAVIQIVAGVLKVNWIYTFVPTLVCHLVG